MKYRKNLSLKSHKIINATVNTDLFICKRSIPIQDIRLAHPIVLHAVRVMSN